MGARPADNAWSGRVLIGVCICETALGCVMGMGPAVALQYAEAGGKEKVAVGGRGSEEDEAEEHWRRCCCCMVGGMLRCGRCECWGRQVAVGVLMNAYVAATPMHDVRVQPTKMLRGCSYSQ